MRTCEICKATHLDCDNRTGVCKNNPECIAEWHRRYWKSLSEKQREERRERWRNTPHSAVLLRNARQRAKAEGFPCSITKDDIPEVPSNCPSCGVKLIRKGPWRQQPSLDRLVPSRGYVQGNVMWLCRRCNQIKSNATPDELMRIALFVKEVVVA